MGSFLLLTAIIFLMIDFRNTLRHGKYISFYHPRPFMLGWVLLKQEGSFLDRMQRYVKIIPPPTPPNIGGEQERQKSPALITDLCPLRVGARGG